MSKNVKKMPNKLNIFSLKMDRSAGIKKKPKTKHTKMMWKV